MNKEECGRQSEQQGFVVVHTASGEMEAEALRSMLEAAGIPAELCLETATKLYAVTVDGLGAVRIRVPADRAEEARTLIRTPAEPLEEEEEERGTS